MVWKKDLTALEEYKNIVRAFREAVRKVKGHLALNLAREVKDKKKGFFKYVNSKKKTGDNVGLLLNEVGALVTEDAEKVELLNIFFALIFTTETGTQESQTLEVRESLEEGRLSFG